MYEFIDKYKLLGYLFGDHLYDKVNQHIKNKIDINIEDIYVTKAAEKIKCPGIFMHGL